MGFKHLNSHVGTLLLVLAESHGFVFSCSYLRLQPMSTWSCGACTHCRGSQACALLGCILRCWKHQVFVIHPVLSIKRVHIDAGYIVVILQCDLFMNVKSIGSWVLVMSVYTGFMHHIYVYIYTILFIYIYISLSVCFLTLSIQHFPRSFQQDPGWD